jgi:glycosyltransferase involved in cell wall biosynthesis
VLSILIPCYNNNIYTLVECLHQEATNLSISFEIIVQDDHSTNLFNNKDITLLDNCYFLQNAVNLGRAKNRNVLLLQAQYDWVLLLDADTIPSSPQFLSNYLHYITQEAVIQGGITYNYSNTSKHLLRWKYGNKREAIDIKKRQIDPYTNTLCSNLFFNRKKVSHLFNTTISLYGYEDLLFYKEIKKNNHRVIAIDNSVEHLGLETNKVFLQKTEESCYNLAQLIANNTLLSSDTKLSIYYQKIHHLKLTFLLSLSCFVLKKRLYKHLLSTNATLLGFDIYKLIIYHQATKEIEKK